MLDCEIQASQSGFPFEFKTLASNLQILKIKIEAQLQVLVYQVESAVGQRRGQQMESFHTKVKSPSNI